jgi:hypothetical protein
MYSLVLRGREFSLFNEISFPFVHAGGILDLHFLGMNIDIQAYKYGETDGSYSVIKVNPRLGELHYGYFGGRYNKILRLRDTRDVFPLKLLSLFGQQIDCGTLPSLHSLEHLELYKTAFVNGSLGMLLKGMSNLQNLILEPLDAYSFANISISAFPLNLRHLLLKIRGNLEFVQPAPRFEKMETLGLRVKSSSGLNSLGGLSAVFPNLKFCFLDVDELAFVKEIQRIETLEKLIVKGMRVNDCSQSKASFPNSTLMCFIFI